ncbi:Hypothetical predicted protein [Pelobates cultripes]|uniref:Uncharacterized protein n=1 Tax=Pelobates cultripes TaxID=61616 RepID=A0AAD1R313_PELCU|nr:Hypothetical predicted protein [Pelobates cultripes]
MAEIHRLEALHKLNPQPSIQIQLTAARELLKRITAEDTARALMWLKQKYYEKSNKADSMLARKLKHRIQSKQILQVRTPTGQTSDIPEQIGQIFQTYYTDL